MILTFVFAMNMTTRGASSGVERRQSWGEKEHYYSERSIQECQLSSFEDNNGHWCIVHFAPKVFSNFSTLSLPSLYLKRKYYYCMDFQRFKCSRQYIWNFAWVLKVVQLFRLWNEWMKTFWWKTTAIDAFSLEGVQQSLSIFFFLTFPLFNIADLKEHWWL